MTGLPGPACSTGSLSAAGGSAGRSAGADRAWGRPCRGETCPREHWRMQPRSWSRRSRWDACHPKTRLGRCLIVAMLVTAAALDLARCGLLLAADRHPVPAAGLVAAGPTVRTARGCQACRRWAGWAALVIGGLSAPQAAASGFRSPYTIPDTATAALGILLAITILATAGRVGRRDTAPEVPASWTGEPRGDPERGLVCTRPWCPGRDPSISVESLLRLAECTATARQLLTTPALGIGNLGPNVAPSENRSEGGPELPPSSRSGETCAGCRVLGDRGEPVRCEHSPSTKRVSS